MRPAFPVRDARAMSFKHKIGNLVLSLAMSVLYFRWVRDSQSGMWVFRRSILKGMQAGVRQHGVFGGDQDRGAEKSRRAILARSRFNTRRGSARSN